MEIAGFDDASLWVSVHAVAVLSGNLTGAAKICRLMTDASRPPVLRAEGHVLQAHLACARGRWGESWDHLAAAKSFEGPRTATDHHIAAIESQATLAITPQFVLSRAHLQNTLHELANLEEESMRRRVFRLYLVGILSVRLGDHAAALRRAAALDSIRSAREEREDGGEEGEAGKDGEVELASSWPVLVESLAHGVRAEVAWSLGKPAEALLEIEQTHPEVVWKAYVLDLMYSLTHQRFMRAMLLENAGRLEEALQWYSSLGQVSAQGYVYLAPKHLKMGEIYERLGEAEKAAENYQRFVELWQDCDPEYRSSVDEVRARIPRLES